MLIKQRILSFMIAACQKLWYFPHPVGSGGQAIKPSGTVALLLGRINQNQQWATKWPIIKVGRDDCLSSSI
jgi:hypothetical protein